MNNKPWNIDTTEDIKVIKVLLYNKSEPSLVDYFSSISDVKFTTRASELRYGDTYYYHGDGTNIRITIVPTITILALPRQHRRHNWFYVAIYCHPDDTRFDDFPGFDIINATQYHI
jgi:hypothetical protein